MNSSGFVVMENIITKDEPVDIHSSDLGDMTTVTTEQQVEMYSSDSADTETIVAKAHLVKTEIIMKNEEIIETNSADLNMHPNTSEKQLDETYFSDPGDVKECIMKETNTRNMLLEEVTNEESDDDIFSVGDSGENKTELIDITKIKMEVDIDYINIERYLPIDEIKNEHSDNDDDVFSEGDSGENITELIDITKNKMEYVNTDYIDMERTEENPKQLQCSYCNYKVTSRDHFTRHLKRVHRIHLLSCRLCGYKTNSEDCLKKHQVIHGDNAKFECPQCQNVFSSKNNVEEHLLRKHSSFELVTTKIHICDTCCYKSNSAIHLLEHINSQHSQLEKFQCNYCSRVYLRKYSLKLHISSIHLKLSRFLCKDCNKVFTKKLCLDSHIVSFHPKNEDLMRTVTNKIHKCDHCIYKCISKMNMTNHMKTHRNIHEHLQFKNFQCNYCSRVFILKNSLTRHISSVHLKLRRYFCKACKNTFTTKGLLDDHIVSFHQKNLDLMKTVTNKIHKCDRCIYRCISKKKITLHKKIHCKF